MFPAALQPGDGRFQLALDEFEGQGFNRGAGLGQALADGVTLLFADCQLAINDAFGGQVQQGGDVEPGEELDADAVDAGRGLGLGQPVCDALLAQGRDGVFGAGRRVGLGQLAAGDHAVAFQALEHRVELADAHVPDPPEVGRVAKAFQQVVAVSGVGLQQAEQDFIRG